MKLAQVTYHGRLATALYIDSESCALSFQDEPRFPGTLAALIGSGASLTAAAEVLERAGRRVATSELRFLPPLAAPAKILCIGLNYAEHASEAGIKPPTYPTVFARFASSLIGHGQPLIRPQCSKALDYEGELVAVIGKSGRHISKDRALEHVVAYSVFNDASVRDYQMKSPQWTMGKNFDGTGAFGPYLTLASALPAGARGLRLETRLNGELMQSTSTEQMIFDVPSLVAIVSEAITLEAGDIIVTGTPSGVGAARKPPLFMKAGDRCEVSIEGVGELSNVVQDEPA
jgi:acylpyruvate hydrolase